MKLIDVFTDYIVNRKSLRDYVEVRKGIDGRGEFNDETLLQIQDNLDRLKAEDPKTLDEMYKILNEIIKLDRGHAVEYPIDFAKEILKMHKMSVRPKDVLESYKQILTHKYHDA